MSLPNILREYGEAFRGDWSSVAIDGRGVRSELGDIARWIEEDAYPGDEKARELLGICPAGHGHWEWLYCGDECAARPAQPADSERAHQPASSEREGQR